MPMEYHATLEQYIFWNIQRRHIEICHRDPLAACQVVLFSICEHVSQSTDPEDDGLIGAWQPWKTEKEMKEMPDNIPWHFLHRSIAQYLLCATFYKVAYSIRQYAVMLLSMQADRCLTCCRLESDQPAVSTQGAFYHVKEPIAVKEDWVAPRAILDRWFSPFLFFSLSLSVTLLAW